MPSGQIDDPNADEEKPRTQLCANFAKKPVTSWSQTASLFRWAIFFLPRGLPMSAVISFWRARFNLSKGSVPRRSRIDSRLPRLHTRKFAA